MYALCNESITDLTLIAEQHSRKHAAAMSKLSIEEKSEDTKRYLMKLEKQRGNFQKLVKVMVSIQQEQGLLHLCVCAH